MSDLNNANYFEFPQAVLVIFMNMLHAIESNPAKMYLLCVAGVMHWKLETGVLVSKMQHTMKKTLPISIEICTIVITKMLINKN